MSNGTGNGRRKAGGFAIILLLGFLFVLGWSPCAGAAPVGKVTYVDGNVDVTPPGGKAQALKLDDPVRVGDMLRTKSRSRLEVTFTDGNILRLAENTRLRVTQYEQGDNKQTTMNLLRGKTQNIVNALGKGSRYEVHTPTAICGVRGSNWFTLFQRGESNVIFLDGQGYGYNPNFPQDIFPIPKGMLLNVKNLKSKPLLLPISLEELRKLLQDTEPPKEKPKEDGKKTPPPPGPPPGPPQDEDGDKGAGPKPPGSDMGSGPGPQMPPNILLPPPHNPPVVKWVERDTQYASAFFSVQLDREGGVVQYRLDGSNWQPAPGGTITLTGLAPGPHTIEIMAVDAAGNYGNVLIWGWTAEVPPPPPPPPPPPLTLQWVDQKTAYDTAVFRVTASRTAVIYYRLDHGDWIAATETIGLKGLAAGPHRIEIKAVDASGSESNILTWNWTAEGPAPPPPPPPPPLTLLWVSQSTLYDTASFSTRASRTATIYYRLDGGAWVAAGETISLTGLSAGPHTIEIKAVDASGNESNILTWEWTAESPPPPPPPPPPPTQSYSGTVEGSILYYDEASPGSLQSGGEASGTLSGTGPLLQNGTTTAVTMTGTWTQDADYRTPSILYGSGWYVEGEALQEATVTGRFKGYFVGVWGKEPEVGPGLIERAKFLSLYVAGGKAGLLYGDMTGSYGYGGPEVGSIWTASGNLTAVDQGPTTLTPDDVPGTSPGSFEGKLVAGTDIYSTTLSGMWLGLSDQGWGIWNMGAGGLHNMGTPSFSAKAGGSMTTAYGYSGYWLADIASTDWGLPTEYRFTAAISNGLFLTQVSLGSAFTTTPYGGIMGTYNTDPLEWQAAGLGTFQYQLLSHVSPVNVTHMLYYSDGSGLQLEGAFGGLIGGTQSLWGSETSLTAMGSYMEGINAQHVWSTPISSYNYVSLTDRTYDLGAYWGVLAGTEKNHALRGRLIALYIDPAGNAGYLWGSMTDGEGYPALDIYKLTGSVYPVQMDSAGPTVPGPADLLASIYDWHGPDHMRLAGTIGEDGTFDNASSANQYFDTHSLSKGNTPARWGIYDALVFGSSTPPSSGTGWTGKAGGVNARFGRYYYVAGLSLQPDIGHWVADVGGGAWTGSLIGEGSLDGRYLSMTRLGTISGHVLGTYNADNPWQAVSVGRWEGTDLSYVSEVPAADLKYYTGTAWETPGQFGDAYMGGIDSLWGAPVDAVMIGSYTPSVSDKALIWHRQDIRSFDYKAWKNTTYDGGAYRGYMGGIAIPGVGAPDQLEARFMGLYLSPSGLTAGYLQGSLTGLGYRAISAFDMDGGMAQLEMDIWTAPLIPPETLTVTAVGPLDMGTTGFEIPNFDDTSSAFRYQSIQGTPNLWGAWQSVHGGAYTMTAQPPDAWAADSYMESPERIIGMLMTGSQWSASRIEGKAVGHGADISGTPYTWVSVGDVLGTFNPDKTFQMVAMGPWIETARFLDMTGDSGGRAKLEALNIPGVEVGSATLTLPAATNKFTSLNMNDVKFFAHGSGQAPSIWATGSIGGSYAGGAPGVNVPVTLQGGGLSADFILKQWAGDKWMATIEGSGTGPLPGWSYTGSVDFKGAGAGAYTGSTDGSITGTASGTAK